jgi:hypothetical protein
MRITAVRLPFAGHRAALREDKRQAEAKENAERAVRVDRMELKDGTTLNNLIAIVVRFVFFFPRPWKALRRTQRSYDARARKVAALALELFDKPEQSERVFDLTPLIEADVTNEDIRNPRVHQSFFEAAHLAPVFVLQWHAHVGANAIFAQ